MVETITEIESARSEKGSLGAEEFVQLGRVFLESVPEDRKHQWPGKVMAYLADETIRCAFEGNGPPRISTKAIHADLGGNPNQEPSAWLSPLWKAIEQRYLPEITETLIERCREMGLDVYPVLEKVEGKPAYYRLSSKKIPENISNAELEAAQTDTPPSAIHYKKDLSLQLSSTGQIFFGKGMKWTAAKRYGLLTWQLLFLIAVVAYLLLVGLVFWFSKGALTGQHLILLVIGAGFAWWSYRHTIGVWQLFEDRIMIAPDWMLAWKEFGATVEIIRSTSTEIPMTIHVNRYSTTCPVCGWMVKLEKGEPDFTRRLVGRCEENPREHVFSFDRSTKLGWALRAIPRCKKNVFSEKI
jgi:hypothetical protein